jgi:F0F1-type ATP synthase epsilon subunit
MGGFAEITAERCTIVATEAVTAEQLTDSWIAERVREAEEAYERLALTGDVDAREEALKKKLIGTMRAGMGG